MRDDRATHRQTRKKSSAALIALALLLRGSLCNAEPTGAAPAVESRDQESREAAQRWFALGREAYAERDYEAAVSAFRRSYSLMPAPALLFNIARALRFAGRCEEAVDHYKRYQESNVQLPADFEALFADAKACADAKQSPATTAAPGASAAVAPAGDTSKGQGDATPSSTNGTPAPAASSDAEEATATKSAESGSADKPAQGWGTSRWLGISCLGVAVGGGVASFVFAKQAESASERTSQVSSDGGRWDDQAQANEDDGHAAARWSIGLGIASGVAAAAGVWFLLSERDSEPYAVQVATTPSGLSTTLHGSF